MADNLDRVVESPDNQRLAAGFVFTEGPLWHPGGYWLFVDIRRAVIHKLTPGGQPEVFRDNSGGSNGLTFDAQGRLLMCEGDNRQITRMDLTGSGGGASPIAQRIGGKRLNRPNDIVCHSNGSIYFSDPGGRIAPEDRELDYMGIHRIAPDGTVTTVATETEYPNGLGFSPDEGILYVTITRRDQDCVAEKERGEVCRHQLIRAFDVAPDGSLSNNRVFAELPSADDGVPDGMKVDVEGRVYCTGAGGCWVFEASGNHLGTIVLPELPANCAWGGPDNRTMLFTARTSVYTMRMKTPGIPVHGAALAGS